MSDTSYFFDDIFNNAKANAVLIMNEEGIVERVNEAFTTAYGYTTEDLHAKHFRLLFVERDQVIRRPELELETTKREGAATDENYLVHKDGTPIWVTGEAIHVKTAAAARIVKIIHNIHAQKQLERYLLSTTELLDSLFNSVQQSGLLILDSRIRIIKMNERFRTMFGITEPISEGAKLQQINHPFWQSEEVKNDIRNVLVGKTALHKDYVADRANEQVQHLHIVSKTLIDDDGAEKRVLLMIKEK